MKQQPSAAHPKRKSAVGIALSAALLIGMLGAGAPSGAKSSTGQIVAAPGATLPFGNYATTTVVVRRGESAVFRNYDIAPHDVDSSNVPPLFSTPTIGTGKSINIWQVASLPVGKYPFHCSVHFWMKGRILVK